MILALDTATRLAGLALYDGETLIVEQTWRTTDKHHTEWLVPAIDEAFKHTETRMSDLTAVAVARGPGSFNGLRVAMSVAKGLVAALNLPLLGISTLDIIAAPYLTQHTLLLAAVSLGRGRFAYHFYQPNMNDPASYIMPIPPAYGKMEAIIASLKAYEADITIKAVGEFTADERAQVEQASTQIIEFVPNALALRRPGVLAMLAHQRLQKGEQDDPHTLEPIYLQPQP
jgi:tRNA threonylcarbamoyladenosine biosynthesis protein TsaB